MPETNEQAYKRLTEDFNTLRKLIDNDRSASLRVKAERLERLISISDRRDEALKAFSKEETNLILNDGKRN